MGFFDEFTKDLKDFKNTFEDFKTELKGGADEITGEIRENIAPVADSLDDVKKEVKGGIDQFNAKVANANAKLKGNKKGRAK